LVVSDLAGAGIVFLLQYADFGIVSLLSQIISYGFYQPGGGGRLPACPAIRTEPLLQYRLVDEIQ